MKKIKSFLMVLSIIGLFVFASCKNSFTPEQIKVACNTEKIKIKGVAKIGNAFVPKGTIINLIPCFVFENNNCIFFPIENMTVNDDEGHFESKNQYTIEGMKILFLEIKQDWNILMAKVQPSTKEVVYNFIPKFPLILPSNIPFKIL